MREIALFYTPEWRFSPESPDPGSALFLAYADMLMRNVDRLNQVPHKNFVAFLSMLDASLAPSRSSETYLTFELANGVPHPVLIPQGTKVSAATAAGEEVMFETEQTILATPAVLNDVVVTNGKHDFVSVITDSFYEDSKEGKVFPCSPFYLETLPNHQQHSWYLTDPDLFRIRDRAVIHLTLHGNGNKDLESRLAKTLADSELAVWTYYSGGEWVPFDDVTWSGNNLILIKKQVKPWEPFTVNDDVSRWLRCQVMPKQVERILELGGGLSISNIQLKTDYLPASFEIGLIPDVLFANDVQASDVGCYPFGEHFAPYGIFSLSCEEAFTKPGSEIRLRFRMKLNPRPLVQPEEPKIHWKWVMRDSTFAPPTTTPVHVSKVVWEYWNGNGWMSLETAEESESLFARSDEEEKSYSVCFRCPADLAPTQVQSQEGYWIRARILQVDGLYGPNPVYMSPWLSQITLTYSYEESIHRPLLSYSVNQAEVVAHHVSLDGTGFQPFHSLDCKHPCLYLGFEQPPIKGPISMYLNVLPVDRSGPSPVLAWEYMRTTDGIAKWARLHVVDQTSGFTESGIIRFAGPDDMTREKMFGQDRYWIRVVNMDDRHDLEHADAVSVIVNGLYLNTVDARQLESIRNELAEPVSSFPYSEYSLAHVPIIHEEVWVDETGSLTHEQLVKMEAAVNPAHRVEIIRDSQGNVMRVWVLWKRVEQLYDSKPDDRHYTLMPESGKLTFGDGRFGKALPQAGLDKVKVSYKTGGGRIGNVGTGEINQLEHSIPFIQAVYNPVPAVGGCDQESLDQALTRFPKAIKHRYRAVTNEDFEWMTREAHPGIAKVKCFSNRKADLQHQSGHVAVVVLPVPGSFDQQFFELKRKITQFLLDHASATTATREQIHVIEPVYLEVSVHVELEVRSMEQWVSVELEAQRKLEQFLDPLTGHFHGLGWEIGQKAHLSQLFSLLKSVEHVRALRQLSFSVQRIERGERSEISQEQYEDIMHGVICSGHHHISIRS